MDRIELRGAILEWQNRLDTLVRGIDPHVLETEPVVGEWPVKLVACHLADWIEEILIAAKGAVDGVPVPGHPIPDHDLFNHEHVAKSEGATWAETSAQLHRLVERAAGFVDELEEGQLELPAVFPWGGEGTLAALLEGIPWHHEEHVSQLRRWQEAHAA